MRRITLSILSIIAFGSAFARDWATYRVFAATPEDVQKVADSNLTLLSEVVGWTTDVAAPNDSALRTLGLRYQRIGSISDPTVPYVRLTDGTDYKTEYLRYNEILAQYEEWRAEYPTLITREQIGTSIQNRPIWVYRLTSPFSTPLKKGLLIQGGIHAREWISPPVCMYIFESMLNEGLSSAAGWELLSRYELNVVPDINPDGYEYTWTNNRMWRKNRRNNGGGEYGVDLNRNYSKGWGGQGSSGNPGSETYRGTAPFSEPETDAIRDYMDAKTGTLTFNFIIDYHSYGQHILYPWSYTYNPAPDAAQLDAIGNIYRNAVLASGGVSYDVGQGSTALYIAAGSSKDFYYDSYGANAYTVELRPSGSPGFELPPSQILPTIKENWAGFKAVLKSLL